MVKDSSMSGKISVVVPVYNTKNELHRCLRSIQQQTYKNIEIICIDDGSSDGSENIVDEFAQADDRFIVVHQTNAGESHARNVGLNIATGDYIAFCDCDDWIELDMYENMLSVMEEDALDFVAASWFMELPNESNAIQNKLTVSKDIFGRDKLLKYLYMRDYYRGFAYMWNKLYRKKVVEQPDGEMILFDEELKLGGDVLYLARVALNVKKGRYVDQAFYHYNQRETSGCHTQDVSKLNDWLTAYKKTLQLFEEHKVPQETIDYVKRFMAYHSSNFVEIAAKQKDVDAVREFQMVMKEYEREYTALNQDYPERIMRFNELLMK